MAHTDFILTIGAITNVSAISEVPNMGTKYSYSKLPKIIHNS